MNTEHKKQTQADWQDAKQSWTAFTNHNQTNNSIRIMKTYIVKFNKAVIHADSIKEAKAIALGLIDRTCPHVAAIIEIDEDGHQSTVAKFDASHAEA